jgi:hypothetical protein
MIPMTTFHRPRFRDANEYEAMLRQAVREGWEAGPWMPNTDDEWKVYVRYYPRRAWMMPEHLKPVSPLSEYERRRLIQALADDGEFAEALAVLIERYR